MEIRNLDTFVQVAELNSFTKAARALDYSQSTISFQIKQLEDELGCLLFERINHTIALTEKGRELLAYAQQVRHLTDEFKQNMNDSALPKGSIHIVMPDSVCESMILQNYVDFYRRYPGVSLKFTTADTDDMFRMLNHNEADVMLTLDSHVYQSDYIIAKEEPVPMHFVAAPQAPFVHHEGMTLRELAAAPFILTERGMGYRHVLDRLLAQQSLDIHPILEIGRTDLIANLVEQGIGVSFLPDFVTQKKVEEGKLVYLNVEGVEIDVWKQMIYHRKKWISKCMRVFIEYMKEHEFGN